MRDYLLKYIQLSDEEYNDFMSICRVNRYPPKSKILQAEIPSRKLLFVRNGAIHGYRIIDGNFITHYFFLENEFATDYESFLTGKPGELYLDALMDTTAYEIDKNQFWRFCDKNPKFYKIRAILAEYAYLQMVERLKEFQTKDLKARYLNLISRNPQLFNLVPQKHIASYLGVAPQSLSRVKQEARR